MSGENTMKVWEEKQDLVSTNIITYTCSDELLRTNANLQAGLTHTTSPSLRNLAHKPQPGNLLALRFNSSF